MDCLLELNLGINIHWDGDQTQTTRKQLCFCRHNNAYNCDAASNEQRHEMRLRSVVWRGSRAGPSMSAMSVIQVGVALKVHPEGSVEQRRRSGESFRTLGRTHLVVVPHGPLPFLSAPSGATKAIWCADQTANAADKQRIG